MVRRLWWSVVVSAMAVGLAAAPHPAEATLRFGALQVSGNLQSQNLIRTPDASTFEFIQNRNTAHIRLDYEWFEGGKFIGKYNIPFVEKSNFTLLWRGVYDSIYSFTPGLPPEDRHQWQELRRPATSSTTRPRSGSSTGRGPLRALTINNLNLNSLGDEGLDALRFENDLRESYIDMKFRGVPLSMRAGRQQVVWGESDNFRMLDRANALNLTWHFQQEIPAPAFGWDEIRRPFWMFKFLYDMGNIWKFSQSFLEWYWNPGDWLPAKQAFLPRPWGLPFYNPLTNIVDGAFYRRTHARANSSIKSGPRAARAGKRLCNRLHIGTKLFGQGDYDRNPPTTAR